MDYQRFIEQLPRCYQHWGTAVPRSHDESVQQMLVAGEINWGAGLITLLGTAIAGLEEGEVYCEVSSTLETSLKGVLLKHPDQFAYAASSCPNPQQRTRTLETLSAAWEQSGLSDHVFLSDEDFESFFWTLRAMEMSDPIGCYFLEAGKEYRSVLMGLLLVEPFLAERCLLVVGNSTSALVQQAIRDFLLSHASATLLLELPPTLDRAQGWGDGLLLIAWNRTATPAAIPTPQTGEIVDGTTSPGKEQEDPWQRFPPLHRGLLQTLTLLTKTAEEELQAQVEQYRTGVRQQILGQLDEAIATFQSLLQQQPYDPCIWLALGNTYAQQKQYNAAQAAFTEAIALDPASAVAHYSLGGVQQLLQEPEQAMRSYEQAIACDASFISAYIACGDLLSEQGDEQKAERLYWQVIEQNPEGAIGYQRLGQLRQQQQRFEEAIHAYQEALRWAPDDLSALQGLSEVLELRQEPVQAAQHRGRVLQLTGKLEEAIAQFEQVLAATEGSVSLYRRLADCYYNLRQPEQAIAVCEQGLQRYPDSTQLWLHLILMHHFATSTERAIAVTEQAMQRLPGAVELWFEHQRLLPSLYDHEAEIGQYRQRFADHLETLIQSLALEVPQEAQQALIGLGSSTNFFLGYQGQDDRLLQSQFGKFVHRIMAANYPQFTQPRPLPPLTRQGKLRIGYVSGYLRQHTVTKLFLGWLQQANRQEFELYAYFAAAGDPSNAYTELCRLYTDQFRCFSDPSHNFVNPQDDPFARAVQQILDDQLHVLVFLDVGMKPMMTKLAGLRLAPVQCLAWGHPITSGSPTMDYFLSSDLMEPAGAAAHYSEQLVRLPNIGISYTKPPIPVPVKSRTDFGLRENGVVYLCCQSLFKYLPQYDFLFVAIAQQIPQSQFVFIEGPQVGIRDQFRRRLQRAFESAGLDGNHFCVFVPVIRQEAEYLTLNLLSDVYLDSVGWSGGNTTLEAIACGLPVVTLPGEFMRGRHSYAILRQLGVTETIAASLEEYVAIAVRLGLEEDWRRQLSETIRQRHGLLFEDSSCVRALEAFYRSAVQQYATESATRNLL